MQEEEEALNSVSTYDRVSEDSASNIAHNIRTFRLFVAENMAKLDLTIDRSLIRCSIVIDNRQNLTKPCKV